jgi:hypothetical protein
LDSIVRVEELVHPEKHFTPMTSTEEGTQTEDRDGHSRKVRWSKLRSSEPDSNLTVDRNVQPENAPALIRWIDFGTITSPIFPKCSMIEVRRASSKKGATIAKWAFPSASEISSRIVPLKAQRSIRWSRRGTAKWESDKQC